MAKETSGWLKRRAVVACAAGALACGCAYETGDGDASDGESWGEVSNALYDSADQVTTARLAMRDAQARTRANGNRSEFCGLIVRKSNGQYRAGAPTTSNDQIYCAAGITLFAGETVTGYYHTHPYPVLPYFSPEDIDAAEADSRQYFVAGSDDCGYWYDPTTNTTWHLGCPF